MYPKQLCHHQESLALLQFKQSFLITCSASKSAFAHPKVRTWLNESFDDQVKNGTSFHTGDCCMWDGVKCNKETGHVISLNLSSSCLYGTFPQNSTLFSLYHLQVLDLSDNDFNFSQIPSAIERLSKLTKLNLSSSDFSGHIPLGILKLSSLSSLDLSLSAVSGSKLEFQHDLSFQKLVSNLTHLTRLYLNFVDISYPVPVSLTNLTSLKSLSLATCNLYGRFPPGILLLPKLELVDLSGNVNLRRISSRVFANSSLQILDFSSTSFSGELPHSVGNLGSLTELTIWKTGFTGQVPSSLVNLTKLTSLTLSDLSFKIYPQILNSWLIKLSKLEHLALHNTGLWGEIPPALANLTQLNWLDLNSNPLTGPFPVWLANLTKLNYLDLLGNQFQGPVIPPSFSQLINLKALFLSSNGSVAMFDTLLKLPYLNILYLSDINLRFFPNASTNSSLPKFSVLELQSCNLTEFPQFLHHQDNLMFLSFKQNNIVGTIPQWFVNRTLDSLSELDLSDNFLTGFEQPPQVFLPWNNLGALYIQGNLFQGRLLIPSKSLLVYHASGNRLYGDIPKQICNASSLAYLDLSMNNFSGEIQTCIGPRLGNSLQVLNLRGNLLQGTIPQTFTRACKLKMINLSENQLKGPLPKSLSNCRMLEVLDVGKNHLNDTFPSWLGSLSKLSILVLRHNNFHGRIPTPEPGHHFSSLRIIDLSNNFHTGNLPYTYLRNWLSMEVTSEAQLNSSSSEIEIHIRSGSNIFMTLHQPYSYIITISNKGSETVYSKILTVFRVIDFSSNSFTGGIPVLLGNLRGLQALNLSNNQLHGGIPSSFANIIDLEALDLSQNMLSGEIPQQLTELTFLAVFNVSHNRLEGQIPQGEQFNTFDNSSFDGNLALCGFPLSEKCEDTDPPQQPPPGVKEEDSELIDWIIRSLGCASGFIVGFIIGKIYITDRHHDWFMETFGRKRPKPRARRSTQSRRRNR
ncbi:receptor like protein 30-like [Chenopodium quinoa]|uniref:receptor like protein 30-like n=1 Tax=Chenopodium quinoa TaxID=63459 RepID=UPI000B777AF6|nr:receptor like protein 30-like [Chenopodium quinoa]